MLLFDEASPKFQEYETIDPPDGGVDVFVNSTLFFFLGQPFELNRFVVNDAVGFGFTVIVMDALSLHPFASVPVTVYVVVLVGLAVTGFEFVVLRPVDGLHE